MSSSGSSSEDLSSETSCPSYSSATESSCRSGGSAIETRALDYTESPELLDLPSQRNTSADNTSTGDTHNDSSASSTDNTGNYGSHDPLNNNNIMGTNDMQNYGGFNSTSHGHTETHGMQNYDGYHSTSSISITASQGIASYGVSHATNANTGKLFLFDDSYTVSDSTFQTLDTIVDIKGNSSIWQLEQLTKSILLSLIFSIYRCNN